MPDRLISATMARTGVALYAAVSTGLVAEIQQRHDLSPTATAAVGRLVTGAVLLGANLKGAERISLQISGDGPIGAISAEAWLLEDGTIGARGYARNPHAEMPLNTRGKFDVAGVLGAGMLQITKSYEIGQPYAGVVPLRSGEIAEDLAAYLARSEQIPSVVALGVLANPAGVSAAGGAIAQVLPGTEESAILQLEERALTMPPVTAQIAGGADADGLLRELAGDVDLRARRSLDVRFACRCTRAKVEAALVGFGRDGLERMRTEREETAATCEFCRRVYNFSGPEIADLIERLEKR
ncbi:MAG TPA: Hsp33 family molecular chaperone HslO [Candidatus Tumulicola sp.]